MNFLANLFSNDKMKDMALGMLKKQMVENSIKYVVIDLKEDQSLDVKMIAAADAPMIMNADNMDKIQQMLEEQERTITAAQEANRMLNDLLDQKNEVIAVQSERISGLEKSSEAFYKSLNNEPEYFDKPVNSIPNGDNSTEAAG